MKEAYEREREQYEKDHPELAKKRRRVTPSKNAAKALPSPTASPGVDARVSTASSAPKILTKDPKHSPKNDQSSKSERKSKENEKGKESEKDRVSK